MQHVVMFSGGVASYVAAKRVAEKYGTENLTLLFGDTLIEDEDSYRFLIEASANIYGLPINKKYLDSLNIPSLQQMELRKTRLWQIANECRQIRRSPITSGLRWVQDGRHIWEVFKEQKFVNHRVANCSAELKRKPCGEWVKWGLNAVTDYAKSELLHYPENTTLYVGIDWQEYERMEGIKKGWYPFNVEAPLCWDDMGWLDRNAMFDLLATEGIKPPRLYQYKFPHGNCGGGCVRAGKSQWLHLLKTFPERYDWHCQQEREFRGLFHDVAEPPTILLEQSKGVKKRVSLQELKDRPSQMELFPEWMGCGCFTED